jgi:ribonuclease-3
VSILSDLEKKIGYVFVNRGLLETALTHASLPAKKGQKNSHNERLEFLGDRVVGLAVAAMLYRAWPDEDEGALARRHTALVQQDALVAIGQKLELAGLLRSAGGMNVESALADAVEALMAAVYLDGGYEAAKKVAITCWQGMLHEDATPPKDPKSSLQEWAQERGLSLPRYQVVSRSGVDHAPVFEVELHLDTFDSVRAEAASKRNAEKRAAIKMLRQIEGKE